VNAADGGFAHVEAFELGECRGDTGGQKDPDRYGYEAFLYSLIRQGDA